jgi:hypothetical protein
MRLGGLFKVNSDMAEMRAFVSLQKLRYYPAGFTFMGDMETKRHNDAVTSDRARESQARGLDCWTSREGLSLV